MSTQEQTNYFIIPEDGHWMHEHLSMKVHIMGDIVSYRKEPPKRLHNWTFKSLFSDYHSDDEQFPIADESLQNRYIEYIKSFHNEYLIKILISHSNWFSLGLGIDKTIVTLKGTNKSFNLVNESFMGDEEMVALILERLGFEVSHV